MDLLNTTGKRIRVLRNDLGLTQGEVIQQLESVGVAVDRSYLSVLERTDRVPSGQVIAGLARILRTSADYLLLLTDNPLLPGDVEEEDMPVLSGAEQSLLERVRGLPGILREALVAYANSMEALGGKIAGGQRPAQVGEERVPFTTAPREPQSREDLVALIGSLPIDVLEELVHEAAGIIRKQERKA